MKRTLLCIMDGWGINTNPKTDKYDATELAHPTNYDRLKKEEKYTQIHADSEYVGLPQGQMGNSEVGHLNLGAGRVVYQELTKINKSKRKQFITSFVRACIRWWGAFFIGTFVCAD